MLYLLVDVFTFPCAPPGVDCYVVVDHLLLFNLLLALGVLTWDSSGSGIGIGGEDDATDGGAKKKRRTVVRKACTCPGFKVHCNKNSQWCFFDEKKNMQTREYIELISLT